MPKKKQNRQIQNDCKVLQYKILAQNNIKKDDNMRVGLKFHLFRAPLNEANISNIRFTKPTRTFVCCPRFYFFFKNI